ncbi:hypothetical protein SK066_15170 [Paenibacillus hunanensis]|uniref:hypothetical protein n=1 Tax=Paenibacillus hunanensis TaxID=539262 RepID=UPI002A6AEF37|nr:hypothetical protein [Paenibacillus hunanensis]WPP39956.1 hypothetical protein SK066_15170 [Paenibacillus hunanensis]
MSIFSEHLSHLSEQLRHDPSVLALLLAGEEGSYSGAAGTELNVIIVVSDEEFEARLQDGRLHYKMTDPAVEYTQITGRYISPRYLEKVARAGSEPARFAFMGAVIVFSDLTELRSLINEITEYPLHLKQANINRFYAQFEAWYLECKRALVQQEHYVLHQSIMNLLLFGGRLILAHNEMLYPGQKLLVHMLEHAQRKPEQLLSSMQSLMVTPSEMCLERLYRQVRDYRNWVNEELNWTDYVIMDNEMQWLRQSVSVGDI